MTQGTPRDRRLARELEHMHTLIEQSSFVSFEARPEDCPEEYIVTFTCLGLIDDPEWGPGTLHPTWRRSPPRWVGSYHVAHIYLPAQYPEQPPQIRMKTPVFHSNIKYLLDTAREFQELLARSGNPEHVMQEIETRPELRPLFERMFASYICVDGIILPERGGNYSIRSKLSDICCELGQMIMFQRYNLAHGLNDQAIVWTRWAEKQNNMLPIDNRPFLDKLPVLVTPLPDTSEDQPIYVEVEEQT